ncbi:uncharacterized protein FFUJ_03586 [Fusarium fujikuroi IMI 58289]|uniref:Ubiquinol-cytochrome-c reductase cytochrome c1 n=1 Tax=Gibberella fujikuroi (strain CBS 195.34 / IMI 58289 / NRRL A-6831) TaxID=1279085 RepID=S0DVH8_GIBF5|nr:uncharacterized protein FFUJ_03586 [Fusarium fujikuroi IMI 58289]KLP13847.1 uncharacterized protein LW94_13610 [Fusarium fujikuroi]CCT66549.1 uncharacterized protein FFUJ_03586 [Fusarium fujikuroi IMI 58289]SCN81330.1 uncharacterized protein FFM5_02770 [Fusarium fujikuroi]SCO32178.1 uncharacterized protein FFMR_02325 [Fusarium fujikuroi]
MTPVICKQPDERVIYQATKHVFVGKYAKLRDRGCVRMSINNNLRKGSLVQEVVTQHGFDAVAQTVLKLLSDKVYESDMVVRQRFPDLYEPASVQTAVRKQGEAEATRAEHVAVEVVEQTNLVNGQDMRHTEEDITTVNDSRDGSACDIAGISLSFPVYLPFPTEHLLMEKLQKVLEAACYEYGVRELSSILQERHWDCPEAVELSQWAELLGNKGNLKRQDSDRSLKELLHSIAQIRHTAVHRLRTSSVGLQRFLADAEDLTRALGDNLYIQAIAKLNLETQSTLTELAQNKQSIQLRLEEAQEEIAKQRAELDQKEQDNLRRMEREDMRYCAQAGERLGKALHLVGKFAVVPESEDPAMGGMDSDNACPASDTDSNLDHAEHFEDCSES